eukprot:gene24603-biopygen22411
MAHSWGGGQARRGPQDPGAAQLRTLRASLPPGRYANSSAGGKKYHYPALSSKAPGQPHLPCIESVTASPAVHWVMLFPGHVMLLPWQVMLLPVQVMLSLEQVMLTRAGGAPGTRDRRETDARPTRDRRETDARPTRARCNIPFIVIKRDARPTRDRRETDARPTRDRRETPALPLRGQGKCLFLRHSHLPGIFLCTLLGAFRWTRFQRAPPYLPVQG